MLTTRYVSCEWRRYSKRFPRDSGYCEDQGERIEQWTEFRLLGVLLYRKRQVVRELTPAQSVSKATLGSEL